MKIRAKTTIIVVHTSATPPDMNIGVEEIRRWHMSPPKNWSDIGYHLVIRRDGEVEQGRAIGAQGAHAYPYNAESIGICLIGGITDTRTKTPIDNYHASQYQALHDDINYLLAWYPDIERIVGHRDLSPDLDGDGIINPHEWRKVCPCFDVQQWWAAGGFYGLGTPEPEPEPEVGPDPEQDYGVYNAKALEDLEDTHEDLARILYLMRTKLDEGYFESEETYAAEKVAWVHARIKELCRK